MKDISSLIEKMETWEAPEEWTKITTIDVHTGGEPLRIFIGGYPELKGKNILQKRETAKKIHDDLRTALMWEPRGHNDMYGCIIVPPERETSDFGVLFIHNEGYSSMCGHGIIAVSTALVETGVIPMREKVSMNIDTPAGLVRATVHCKNNQVDSVSFLNVPSFVVELECEIEIPEIGKVIYDLAFGGAFYAYIQGTEFSPNLECIPEEQNRLIDLGKRIKNQIMQEKWIRHPFEKELSFLYGTIFISPPKSEKAQSRNCCIFAEGEVDRSPTGTGVSGRAALHYAKGELQKGERMCIESILGSSFNVSVEEEINFGPYKAIIPKVEGSAFITGKHEFLIHPRDPLKKGFLLR